ncbi:MAG: YezD family protein [Solibacillus sp.]
MDTINEEVYKLILENLKDLHYGTLLITVHNDEITQLDITKKQRLTCTKSKQLTNQTLQQQRQPQK